MIRVFPLSASELALFAPQMFSILSRNMQALHPEEPPCEADYAYWLDYQTAHFSERTYLLAEREGHLAGYLQFSIRQTELLIEEVEIAPDDQLWFGILPRLVRALRALLPPEIETVCAYIHKTNARSARIAEKLGMRPIGETPSGNSLLYAGRIQSA